MARKNSGKKLLKISGIITGCLLLLFFAFHTWINYNARHIIENLVESRSKGKLKMKLEKFRFSWFSRKVELTNAVIYTADSVNAVTAYRFEVQHIKLSVQKIWPIIFDNKLLIDSMNLDQPQIAVTRLKPLPSDSSRKKDVSIPEELGKIYHSIQDALQTLKVNRFQINDARFTLTNRIHPEKVPLRISNIHFHIDNLSVDTSTNQKLLFSDNVVLTTRNQDIVFPDGKQRLSFRGFHINLKQRLVEFDSCTMSTEQKDRTRSQFRVFFDTLRLARIDFDTLYKSEVIKADTVYCLNPRFNLTVENTNRKARTENKATPKLEEIVQQLTGDLLVDQLIVKNADFHIRTNFNERPASFDFTQNNFDLEGLKVSQTAARPITVKRVALAIRNYENFIRDSTYKLKFDSILISENRVFLNQFVFKKQTRGKISNSFSIPRFELTGFSWDDLVFNQQLKASEATLYNPSINYTSGDGNSTTATGKKSIFATLAEIGQVIQLDKMNIVDGQINIALPHENAVQLRQTNLTVRTPPIFLARKARAFEHAVDFLSFSSGLIKAGKVEIALDQVRYTGKQNGYLLARKARVKDKDSRMDITAENAAVDDILTDEVTGDITATGIRWDKADVWLLIPPAGQQKKHQPSIELKDLSGANTQVLISTGNKNIRAEIDEVAFDELLAEEGKPLQLRNPHLQGRRFEILDSTLAIKIGSFSVGDQRISLLKELSYEQKRLPNTTKLTISSVALIPDINAMLQGRYEMSQLLLEHPILSAALSDEGPGAWLPLTRIGKLQVNQPEIKLGIQGRQGKIKLDWNGAIVKENKIAIEDLAVSKTPDELRMRSLSLNLDHFRYTSPKGKHYDAGSGSIETVINDLIFHPAGDEPADWSATVSRLDARQFIVDSIGRKNGIMQVEHAGIRGLKINNDILTDPYQLVAANTRFSLEKFTGNYRDGVKVFDWKNAGYHQLDHTVTVDTFSYRHALDKDSFMARQVYQKDYIAVGCGRLRIGPVNRELFIKDSVFQIGKINIDNAWFTDFKDKRLPFAEGSIRMLPASLVQHIPFRIAADSIQIAQGQVDYTEFSQKTNSAGTIPIRRMGITLLDVKNHGIKRSDSLTIKATGYIMDSIWMQLRVRQSYTDSLGGFKLTMQAKPGDLRVLNPVLIPLVSAKLISGEVDTIRLRAVGREYLAIGEMNMPYKNLRFRYLRSGKDERQRFSTRVLNYFANNFIIRKKNSTRTGQVFAYRVRDRSSINYLLRIALSGMSSSAGLHKNRKLYRRYQQELQQKGLPPPVYE